MDKEETDKPSVILEDKAFGWPVIVVCSILALSSVCYAVWDGIHYGWNQEGERVWALETIRDLMAEFHITAADLTVNPNPKKNDLPPAK